MEKGKKVKEEKKQGKDGQSWRAGGCRRTAEGVCGLL